MEQRDFEPGNYSRAHAVANIARHLWKGRRCLGNAVKCADLKVAVARDTSHADNLVRGLNIRVTPARFGDACGFS